MAAKSINILCADVQSTNPGSKTKSHIFSRLTGAETLNAGCLQLGKKRKKSLIESQMHSTKGVLWTLLCTSQNEPHWILLCRSVQREAQGENPIKFRGAHFSNWQPVLRQQRDRKKKREREREKAENIPHSQTCHPCQVHVKVAWEGKEAMAFSVEPGQHKEHLMMCPDTGWQRWTDSVSSVEN